MSESVGGGSLGVYRNAMSVVRQRLMDDQLLEDEYRAVVEHDSCIDHTVEDSQDPASLPRNRYVNVLPYDYNRVKLASPHNNYINASRLRCKEPGLDFDYIAMQGPLPNTTGDFWQLVLEQGTEHVVMLTNPSERGIIKCATYFPESPGDQVSTPCGLVVRNNGMQMSENGELTVRKLELRKPGHPSSPPCIAHVTHYLYHAWPDHGAPNNSTAIRSIAKILQRWRQENSSNSGQSASDARGGAIAAGAAGGGQGAKPVVVHCSAGIGRTGAFIAVEVMRHRMQQLSQQATDRPTSSSLVGEMLDLPALVCHLRLQRMGMVQTLEQYIFCYQAIYEDLAESLSVANGGPSVR